MIIKRKDSIFDHLRESEFDRVAFAIEVPESECSRQNLKETVLPLVFMMARKGFTWRMRTDPKLGVQVYEFTPKALDGNVTS